MDKLFRAFSQLNLTKTSVLNIGRTYRSSQSNNFSTTLCPLGARRVESPLSGNLPAFRKILEPTTTVQFNKLTSLPSMKDLHTSTVMNNDDKSSYRTLLNMHLTGPIIKKRKNKNPLGKGVPMKKAVVLKTLIKKPKKPNSANRKCVLVRLSTGKEMVAFVPGEGHNLQEHNVVMVRPGRLRDTPGVKIRCIRGKYDLGHVVKKTM